MSADMPAAGFGSHAVPIEEEPDHRLRECLEAQVRAVDQRLGTRDAYAWEAAEVRVAARYVPQLRRRLGLGQLLRDLTPATGKPQFLFVFDAGGALGPGVEEPGPVVLKVYGRRRPGEAALQSYWHSRGLPTPAVHRFADEPVSWLLMAYEAATPVSIGSSDDLLGLTRELASIMAAVHAEGIVPVTGSRYLGQGVLPHLEAVTASLARHGYRLPCRWHEGAEAVYRSGKPVSLHADLFPGNLLRTTSGLQLVDSCGYLGDPGFDAARWAVRVGTDECPPEEVWEAWLAVERELDRAVAWRMLAVESLMQAGVREIVKDERGEPAGTEDPVTLSLLAAAERLGA